MPAGPDAQSMSKMHFGGAGLGMMKHFMKEQQVMSLRELMRQAVDADVKFVVCTMSMGIMGIEKTDLMDLPNLSFGGVTSFTASARESALSMVF
jgi:peroxiredoxin family protein